MNAFHVHRSWHSKLNIIVTAAVFIIVGLLFLGRNLGFVENDLFYALVSWQMLLIVIGVVQLIKRNFIGGLVLIAVGSYFLFPGMYMLGTYWPVFLIIIGIGILFKLGKKGGNKWHHHPLKAEPISGGDGFVNSEVSFGGVKHIVLDPVFKGATLNASFGSISLDLRRTKLETEVTIISIDISFGGIELFLPSNWNVIIEADTTLGGIDDKRFVSNEIDYSHKLVIKGDITFSGLEIKS